MASNEFINECKNNAYKNRLGTISIKDITKKSGSVITTDEAIEGPLNDYKIYGNTYQNSTSGKNLYNINDMKTISSQVIINGETIEISYDNTGGSATRYFEFHTNLSSLITENETYSIICEILEISGTGTVRLNSLNNNSNESQFSVPSAYNISNLTSGQILIANITALSNFENAKRCVRSNIRLAVGQSCSAKLRMSLIKGTVSENDFVYEPYTGGQPSPNPDYPQEIISCGDKTKNLCGELEQGGYDVNTGEKYTNTTLYRNKEPIKVLPNTNYIFSINGVGQAVNVLEYKADGTYIGRIGSGTVSSNSYFTTSSETGYINIFRGASAGIEKWQIEQNDTISSYEPYGYKIPVNVRSENLFDINNNFERNNLQDAGITTVFNTDGTITVNGVKNNNYKYVYYRVTLPAGIYYFCGCPIGGSKNGYSSVVQITSDISSQIFDTGEGNTFILTEPTTIQFFPIRVGTSDVVFNNEVFKPMIAKIPVSYDDYQTYYNETTNIYLDEPLRKIDKYSDYIDFINGKVVRNIGNKVLDGSETYYGGGAGTGSPDYTYVYTKVFDSLAISGVCPIFSSHFATIKGNMARGTVVSIDTMCIDKSASTDRTRFLILTSRLSASTTSAFKTWLSNNPVTVDYILATPTEEDIELPNINLIEGKNIITIGTELESTIEVEYTNWENKIKNSDRLQNITIDNGCIVNNEIIGSVYSKKVTSDILDINELDLENKKIDVKIGVKYDNESHENLNMGKYTIERPKDEQTANIGQIIAYDDLNSKLEDKYICRIDYQQGNKTLKDLYIDLCSQLGLTPKNLEFDNNTIPIANNPFTNGEKNRLVLQTIEKVSGTFSDIDNNTNEIDLCWLSNSVEPDYTFYRNDYTNLEGGKIVYGPINCLVIKNSQIDDENVTIKDDESIALNGEHTLTINEDYILYNSELRQLAINAIWNKVHNLTYVDCKLTTLYGKPFLKLGDKIRVYKTDTEYFDTYVLLHQFTYDGSFESIIQSPALTEQEIKTKQKKSLGEALKNTEVEVNKQKQTITALVQETSENTEKTSQLQLQSDEINQRIEDSQYYIDENGNKKTISGSINELKSTAEELNLNLQKIGGLNLMKNSSGQNGTIGYKSKMLKPYVEFQTWAEFDNYISLGSKVYQIYTCFVHVVGETTDSERDCWYGLYYTEGFSKSYYFEQVVRNGNFIYPDKYNKYMDILYDNLFMFVEQNYTNSSSFKTFLEKYTDEYTNITPNIFTSISNDIIENNTISKSAFLLTPTVRDMYTTMNEDRIYGENFTMPKNTNKLYFSVKSKIDGLCGRARLIMYQLNDKMENIQNNLNVYDSYENHIVNANFINIPDNILNNDNFIEYKVEMEISDRCVEILPCFSIGNNFVNDGPYVNFVNPILNPITRFYWKKVWETIDEVSAYYTYRSTHIKKKLQFFESATLPEISDTPDFTQLWLCTDEIEGYTKDTLYTPQYEIDSNGEIISRTWIQTDYTKEQIERGIEIIMFDNWTYVYSAGAVESATPRPDMKFIIADCMVSATDTSWQPASGENYWGKNIKISGDKGIYIYNTVDGYNRIIDEKQDIAKDKNGNTTWELTGKGMKTKRAECESIRLPKLEILCTNDSTAFYHKENEDDDYGA